MKEEPKKWSLFDIVGSYSSQVKKTLKAIKAPMETTTVIPTSGRCWGWGGGGVSGYWEVLLSGPKER